MDNRRGSAVFQLGYNDRLVIFEAPWTLLMYY